MTLRVFVNERAVEIPDDSDARAAVHRHDPQLGEQLDAGKAYLTDGRGLPVEPGMRLAAGSILRVVRTARRPSPTESDAR